MRKIFLLFIFVFKYIIADEEESNEKYIDLLPEEEKQEFLNRIARRILADIKSGGTPNESQAVITDDQLDAHDAYVQEILKEESENFKSDKRWKVSADDEEYNRRESSSGNKDEHIDLTLREGRRQKRNNSENNSRPENIVEPHFDVIPVKTVYDQYENNDELKNISESVLIPSTDNENLISKQEIISTNETSKIYSSDFEKTTNTPYAELSNDSFIQDYINETEKEENFRKSFKSKLYRTAITDFEPNSDERTHTTDDFNISDNVIPTTVSIESINNSSDQVTWGSTQKIYAEENSDEKGDLYVEVTTQMYQNSTNNEIIKTESEVTVSTGNFTGESKTYSITDNTTHSDSTANLYIKHNYNILRSGSDSEQNLYKDVRKIINMTETSLPETVTPLLTSYVETTETQFTETENSNVTESTIYLSSSDAKGVISYTDKNRNQTVLDQNTKILRGRLDLEVKGINDNRSNKNRETNYMRVRPYEVFEIDAKSPHFANSGSRLENGQPFYVPVYNYAPDYAYFKPYNKYGPNIEDIKNTSSADEITSYLNENMHSDSINGNRFFGHSNQKRGWHKATRNIDNLNTKQSLKLLELMKPITHKLVTQKIKYKPYDYPDMDYFANILRRGRNDYDVVEENDSNVKHFPDSNEPEHPLYSIHKSETIKDHVRAIRNILYLQKLFGYVPNKRGKEIERKANNFNQRKESSKIPNNNNIDIDYYFDRTGSNEKSANNRMFKVNKNEQLNLNIIPLTPNPIMFGPTLKKKNTRSDNLKHPDSIGISFSHLFEAILMVLNDTIKSENENLVRYDWLKTTVNIQAAIRKLLDLIKNLRNGKYVHTKDIQLFKYTLYIFKTSLISSEGKTNKRIINEVQNVSKNKNRVLPKTNRKDKKKEPLKFWKHFVYLRRKEIQPKELKENMKGKFLYEFEEFLQSLLFYLNDLHDSIKHIAMITKYKKQKWFRDLKDIYFGNLNRKRLAQVLLHLSLSRLLDLLEESAANGVEEDFRLYLKNNGQVVKRTVEEAAFVINILEEFRRINVSE